MDEVFQLLDRLEEDAAWFEALNDYSSEFWLDYHGAREHVRSLNLFSVSQYTPLVLAAKDQFTSPNDLVDIPGNTDWGQFKPDAYERSVERLGNYSLLERNLNSKDAANSAFAEKQLFYSKSQFKTSQELCDYSEWTEEAINSRQTQMAKVAKTVWAIQT